MTRIEKAGKNMFWQALSTVVLSLLNFITRYFFVKLLGVEYLGVEGLFSSVFSVLSFIDLGFASAFTFCFYKAIAEKDEQHIVVILNALKRLFLFIIICLSLLGVALLPFLNLFVKGATFDISSLRIYYLLFLSQSIAGYFFAYKTCYITACQKAYVLMPLTIIGSVLITAIPFVILLWAPNYLLFLFVGTILKVLQPILINFYVIQHFPETRKKTNQRLSKEDKAIIFRNTKGILFGRLGTISVYQTDNIIISLGINIVSTGLVSNYQSIKTLVAGIVSLIQNALVPSMGDFICKEPDKKKQLDFFYTYAMFMNLIIGFAFCGLSILSTPFISLVFGAAMVIDEISVFLLCVGFYFAFQMYALNILPTAGGYINIGAYVAVVEGVVNLIVSIVGVKLFGLPGVYLGTAISAVIAYFLKPLSVFPQMYNRSAKEYFKQTFLGCAGAMGTYFVLLKIRLLLLGDAVTILNFSFLAICVILVYGIINYILVFNNVYFKRAVRLCLEYVKKLYSTKRENG